MPTDKYQKELEQKLEREKCAKVYCPNCTIRKNALVSKAWACQGCEYEGMYHNDK